MKAFWICCLALLCCTTATARADHRVALVIGNGAYRYVDPLTNPRLDARAMKAALERLGFKVVYGEDLDQKHLGQKIAEFAGEAQDADVALTFYAGHGSTFGDMSYLVPVDAEFKSLAAVTYELVPLEQMLGELRRAKGIRIAIIDACRDNAKERELKRVAQRGGAVSRGLARVQSPDGLILAFSTQYGMTAADGAANTNSPFTAALLRQLPTPGLDVRDVFFKAGRDVLLSTNNAQRPAIEVSLYEPYALVPAPPAGVITSATPAPAPAQPAAQMAALPPVVPVPAAALPAVVPSGFAGIRLAYITEEVRAEYGLRRDVNGFIVIQSDIGFANGLKLFVGDVIQSVVKSAYDGSEYPDYIHFKSIDDLNNYSMRLGKIGKTVMVQLASGKRSRIIEINICPSNITTKECF